MVILYMFIWFYLLYGVAMATWWSLKLVASILKRINEAFDSDFWALVLGLAFIIAPALLSIYNR
jgi:hypothetical protein